MKFKIKESRNFNNSGEIYTAPVVTRKLNGYKVLSEYGSVEFICSDDIDILEISADEKQMAIEL